MEHHNPGSFFNEHYEKISQEVNYEPSWVTDDGHLDYALHDKVLAMMLPAGHMLRCLDEHNRKIIFVGTDWGPAVVFQRYSDDSDSIVCQLPAKVAKFGMTFCGYLSLEELVVLLGSDTVPNIGKA